MAFTAGLTVCIALIGKSPLLFIVNPTVPAKTLAEFVALAKQNPGKFNYGTPGAASQAHLLVALWSKLAGIEMQHIPYRGGAPVVLGTVTGEVQLTLMPPIASLAQINAGALRPLATGSAERDPHFPDLPSIAESGGPPQRQAEPEPISEEGWEEIIAGFKAGTVNWNVRRLGPEPGQPGCRVPRDVLRMFGL